MNSSLANKTFARDILLSNGTTLQQVMDGTQSVAVSAMERTTFIDYIESGCKLTPLTGFDVEMGAGVFNISGTRYSATSMSTTLAVRMASLLYLKQGITPTLEKIEAKLPAIDANTVLYYDFTNWDEISPIPNSAVGVNGNTIAVANNLILTNPTPGTSLKRVDGHVGYAMQGDGATGYGVSQNSTGFPIGNNERELDKLYTYKGQTGARQEIINYGTASNYFGVETPASGDNLFFLYNASIVDTGFTIVNGMTYLISLCYDGINMILKVNGVQVYSVAVALTTVASALVIFNLPLFSFYTKGITHYIELRNKMRTSTQIAQISNNLLLPCSHQTPQSPVPLMTANSSQGCVASASSEFSALYMAYMAFRKGSIGGTSGWNSNGLPASNQITYPISFSPKWVDIQSSATAFSASPANFTIYGSNDGGTTKTTLLTVLGSTGWTANLRRRFNILGSGSYTTLGINVTAVDGNTSVLINDLDFGTDEISTTDIREVLPENSISLGYAKTSSTTGVEIDTDSYKYGIRQGAVGGNRKVFLGWKYYSGQQALPPWQNPFGIEKIKTKYVAKSSLTDYYESPVWNYSGQGSVYNGITEILYPNTIKVTTMPNGIASKPDGSSISAGYIGCYAEIIE